MTKQNVLAVGVLLVAWLCTSPAFAQAAKESVTVIREGAGGELQILSREQPAQDEKAFGSASSQSSEAEARRAVATDDAPRKARIVVIPAIFAQESRRRIDRELNERFGITDPGVIESPGYTSYLVDALVNTRKFDVLEREELRQVVRELDFGESEYVDLEKVVKIGNMVGADYMIIPLIRYLGVDEEEKQVPYVGGKQTAIKCKLATNVRTVDVGTGKIISSGVREVEKKHRQRQQDSKRILVMDTISECFKESSLLDAAKLVDVAYPIRIMSIEGDQVMLNRGEGALLKGELLKVYATGEVLIDPETKDNLGYQEAYVGTIQVTDVDTKTSKGMIVDRAGTIERLSICRRVEKPTLDDPQLKQGSSPAPKID
jgi:hypothetical protein